MSQRLQYHGFNGDRSPSSKHSSVDPYSGLVVPSDTSDHSDRSDRSDSSHHSDTSDTFPPPAEKDLTRGPTHRSRRSEGQSPERPMGRQTWLDSDPLRVGLNQDTVPLRYSDSSDRSDRSDSSDSSDGSDTSDRSDTYDSYDS